MSRGIAAGVAVALAFAAMLVGGFGVLLESALTAHGKLDRYCGAVAVVGGHQRVSLTTGKGDDAETETQPLKERARVPVTAGAALRAVPGVRSVVADVSFPVAGSPGTLVGRGADSLSVSGRLTSGRAPQTPDEVVVGPSGSAAVGSTVTLQADGTPLRFRVSGLSDQPGTVFFTQRQAEVLSGHPGSADALVVLGDRSVSKAALRQAAPGLVVATGAERGDVEDLGVAAAAPDLVQIGASLGSVALLVAVLVVTGLLEMSVRSRVRELAVMRAVGALPRQVRRMIVRETLRIALPAALAGGVLSLGLGAALHAVMVDKGVLPHDFALSLSPIPVAAGAATAVLAAVGSAWLASRRVSRISPVQALGEAATEPVRLPRWRVITGIVFLALGVAMLAMTFLVGKQSASSSVGGLVISLIWATALLGPPIARLGIGALGRPLRWAAPITGRLAADGARAAAVRMAAVTTPVALAIAFCGTQLLVQETVTHTTQAQAIAGLHADQVLVSTGPGIPRRALDAVQKTPGVTGVTAVKRTNVVMRVPSLAETTLESLAAEGLSGSTATLDPKVTSGSLADLRGPDTIALSTTVAGDARVGSVRSLWLGDGTYLHPRIVAIYDRGLGFGDVLLPRDLVAAHATSSLDDYLLVRGSAELRQVTERYTGLHATARADYAHALTEQARHDGLVGLLAAVAIAGFILIGVVTTLAVSTASRRRELTLLRLIGATRGQVMRTLRLETVIVLGTGTIVGGLVAGATLLTFAAAITGLSMVTVPPLLCAVVLGTVAAAGAGAVLFPARSMLRRQAPRIE